MIRITGAATLDDALLVLSKRVKENEARGEKNLIFCEDKLTLLAERAVLGECGGTFLTEVTTFARFLQGEGKTLSKQGSVMEISTLILKNEDKLSCFKRGSAEAIYETIAQLSASRVDKEALEAGAAETDGLLKGKLLDLAFLLGQYQAFLRDRGMMDENGYLSMLPKAMETARLEETNVFFFAFSSFTRQAREGIRAAFAAAKNTEGIFLAGSNGLYTNESAGIFRRLAEEITKPSLSMAASSLEGDALALSNSLFSSERAEMKKAERVIRFTARDDTEEFAAVASLIKKHMTEDGARYRDFAVLVAGEESFPVLERVFSSFHIPYFADRKRPFSEHPFCAFTFNVLSAVAGGMAAEDVDSMLSSVYFGNGDNYRNYLLKFGSFRGGVKRAIKEGDVIKDYDREELVSCRDRALEILACFPVKGKGVAFTKGVRSLMSLTDCGEVTASLCEKFTPAEKKFLDLSPLTSALEEFDLVAGEENFTAREFCSALENALSALKISLIPQTVDAVFAGDATDSKFARVKYLFATGLTDRLPRVSDDTAVISDGEIGKLKQLQVEIEPAIAEVNARAREGLALNLCAFSDRLYLSYPLRTAQGDSERGEILQTVEKSFSLPAMPDLFPYNCSEEQPAKLALLNYQQEFEGGRAANDRYSPLYAALSERGALPDESREKPSVKEAGKIYFSQAVSPTLLERYFACPYQGFAMHALKLREREERTVLDTDTGTFVHAVLEKAAKKFNEFEDEKACRVFAERTARELLNSPRFCSLADTRAGEYAAKRLISESAEVSAAAYLQLSLSAFRVAQTERAVSISELSLKGKTDRVDSSDGYMRVIDYKTGSIDSTATSYYMGKKLQLQLYLRAVSERGKEAGAFYFPAADEYAPEGTARFSMSGFYSGEEEVIKKMDVTLKVGEKSTLFDGKLDGKYTDKGMSQDDFTNFLDYAVLVSSRAENEMKSGNIAPSPHEDACGYCKLRSLCGFVGEARKKESVRCGDIVEIVKREKGEA